MTAKSLRLLSSVTLCLLVAACNTGPKGVRISSDGTSATTDRTPEPIRTFSEGEIRAAITGKTFQYTRDDSAGFITYNADGSFSYQDDVKGGGVGRWTAKGGQFCETFGNGPTECGEFKTTGDAYFAARSRLVEMKV